MAVGQLSLGLLLAIGALAPGAGFAATPQTQPHASPLTASPVPAPSLPAIADPGRDLTRLSEIMGSLAFLRELCAAPDARAWRERMSALLEAESDSPQRRSRMAGAFNRGYRSFSLTYTRCTPSAELAIQRYLEEGAALSRALPGRLKR